MEILNCIKLASAFDWNYSNNSKLDCRILGQRSPGGLVSEPKRSLGRYNFPLYHLREHIREREWFVSRTHCKKRTM